MNKIKRTLVVAVVLLGALASGSALAHGHVRFGVFVGGPFWPEYYPGSYYSPGPYYSPYYSPYYYPPVVAVPASPPTYVEQADEVGPVQEQSRAYWYYCAASKTYYPYVKQCPGGWQRVAPQPPGQ
jgi:hypothetical protein